MEDLQRNPRACYDYRRPHYEADETLAVPETYLKQFLRLISQGKYCEL